MIKIEVLGKDEEEALSSIGSTLWPTLVQWSLPLFSFGFRWMLPCWLGFGRGCPLVLRGKQLLHASETRRKSHHKNASSHCLLHFRKFKVKSPWSTWCYEESLLGIGADEVALGNYQSTLLVTVVTKVTTTGGRPGWIADNLNRDHLDYYYYWLLARPG